MKIGAMGVFDKAGFVERRLFMKVNVIELKVERREDIVVFFHRGIKIGEAFVDEGASLHAFDHVEEF